MTQLILEGKRRAEIEQLLTFSCEVGLPVTLAQVGLEDCSALTVEAIAKRTVAQGETIHNEPFPVTSEMVADAIRSADAAGRAWRRIAP